MCGIAGIYTSKSCELNPQLNSMLSAMKHRGPDDRGVWIKEGMYLGHNRLSIIDLSPAGHQPMVSHSGRYVLVYNGEVYNFQALKKELLDHGISFRSHTDTEVILALWEREGSACISRLRGMFAFAIWDHFEKTLTLVRDRLGIKPLYYAQTHKGFVFASEIKGLLASGLVEKVINPVAISHLLNTGYVQQPDTILSSISALLPGHLLVFSNNEYQTREYWNFTTAKNECASEEEAIARTRALVIDAVSEEMISDRPIGVFLSGGLDSTVLLAALRIAGHQHVKTFSVGFDTLQAGMNEADDSGFAANWYESEHTSIHTTAKDLSDHFDAYIAAIDQPCLDGLNTWLVSKFTAPYVTVALSGLGGDELFSGYGVDRRMIYERRQYSWIINSLHAGKFLWGLMPHGSLRDRFEHWSEKATLSNAYSQWGRLFHGKQAALLGPFDYTSYIKNALEAFAPFDPGKSFDDLQRISALHLSTFMRSRLLRDSDAVSMSHSMEVRFPLIDHRLVEMAYPLPMSWKLKHASSSAKLRKYESENSYIQYGVKHLLYQAFKHELPQGFGSRPKRGFHLPMQEWMLSSLREVIQDYLMTGNTYFNTPELNRVWKKWETGGVGAGQVWLLLITESWIKKYLKN